MANPNPSPATRIKPGQVFNPGGKTSEHRKAEIRAAELAAKVRLDLVEALAKTLNDAGKDTDKLEAIRADVLRLLKDSEDRAFGTASQHVDQTSSDGSARLPSRIVLCGPE